MHTRIRIRIHTHTHTHKHTHTHMHTHTPTHTYTRTVGAEGYTHHFRVLRCKSIVSMNAREQHLLCQRLTVMVLERNGYGVRHELTVSTVAKLLKLSQALSEPHRKTAKGTYAHTHTRTHAQTYKHTQAHIRINFRYYAAQGNVIL
jgi:hypothetical protein